MRFHEMCRRYHANHPIVFAVISAAVIAAAPSFAQGQVSAPHESEWQAPRTAWGDPDLQGLWRSLHRMPFERPAQYEGREFLTDAEVAEQARRGEERNIRQRDGAFEAGCLYGFQNQANYNAALGYSPEPVRVSKRTSAIVDPPDGRLPAWTLEQVKRYEAREAATLGRGESDWTIDRGPNERCLPFVRVAALGFWGMALGGQSFRNSAAPDTLNLGGGLSGPGGLGAKRIIQAPGFVAIALEDGGEYEMIRLNGATLSPKFQQWTGDRRGHWEGTTLVVETRNIKYPYPVISNYGVMYPGDGTTLRLTERFTLRAPGSLEYRYTVDDPAVYVRPYTVQHELTRDDQYKVSMPICREAYDSMASMLAGARGDEGTAMVKAAEARRLREPRLANLKAEALKAAQHTAASSSQ